MCYTSKRYEQKQLGDDIADVVMKNEREKDNALEDITTSVTSSPKRYCCVRWKIKDIACLRTPFLAMAKVKASISLEKWPHTCVYCTKRVILRTIISPFDG